MARLPLEGQQVESVDDLRIIKLNEVHEREIGGFSFLYPSRYLRRSSSVAGLARSRNADPQVGSPSDFKAANSDLNHSSLHSWPASRPLASGAPLKNQAAAS